MRSGALLGKILGCNFSNFWVCLATPRPQIYYIIYIHSSKDFFKGFRPNNAFCIPFLTRLIKILVKRILIHNLESKNSKEKIQKKCARFGQNSKKIDFNIDINILLTLLAILWYQVPFRSIQWVPIYISEK
jgi:hypothetical protein